MSQRWFLRVNGVFLIAVVGGSALVDGNGRVMGLSETLSNILALTIFAGALFVAGMLIAKCRG